MPSYPNHISRCQHLKVNGTQCGSPALREAKHCYYHVRYHWEDLEKIENHHEWRVTFPTLEDANAVQISLAQIMERLISVQIDPKTAGLMLYGLQIATMNLKSTSLEPDPRLVIIDRESVAHRPLGASAWSKVEGQEYDDLTAESEVDGNGNSLQKFLPQSQPTDNRSAKEVAPLLT
jgi:hypothetical protein